ncbi:MAG: LLM class flavin-dependent oxidoreductase [Chloroflexi bacterium]|nr:LLM class flavin-dependent oxidoreductase [Chloroflexota bacterium]
MTRLELSIAFQTNKTPAEYAALGQLVNGFDFDVVSTYHDLFFQPAIGPLLILAQHLSHARLGPAALNPVTLHPVEIAGQIAFLDAVTGGRAYLGLARGSWMEAVGAAAQRPIARLRECIQMVRYLWSERTDGFNGSVYSVAPGARLQYAPARHDVPITLGTWGERTARAIGPLVQEVKVGGSANPQMIRRMREWLPPHVGVCVGAVSVVDEDGAAARALARREVAMYLGVVAQLDATLDDPEWVRRIRAHGQDYASISRDISDAMLDRFALSGTPRDIVQHVQELYSAGATRVEFGTPHGIDAPSGIRLLGGSVLPQLKDLTGATSPRTEQVL